MSYSWTESSSESSKVSSWMMSIYTIDILEMQEDTMTSLPLYFESEF